MTSSLLSLIIIPFKERGKDYERLKIEAQWSKSEERETRKIKGERERKKERERERETSLLSFIIIPPLPLI